LKFLSNTKLLRTPRRNESNDIRPFRKDGREREVSQFSSVN